MTIQDSVFQRPCGSDCPPAGRCDWVSIWFGPCCVSTSGERGKGTRLTSIWSLMKLPVEFLSLCSSPAPSYISRTAVWCQPACNRIRSELGYASDLFRLVNGCMLLTCKRSRSGSVSCCRFWITICCCVINLLTVMTNEASIFPEKLTRSRRRGLGWRDEVCVCVCTELVCLVCCLCTPLCGVLLVSRLIIWKSGRCKALIHAYTTGWSAQTCLSLFSWNKPNLFK